MASENVGKYHSRSVIPEGCIIVQFDEYRQLKDDCWKQQQRIEELLSRMNDNSGLKVNKSPQNFAIPEGYTVVQSDEYEQLQKDFQNQEETIKELRSRSSAAFVVPEGYTFVLDGEYRQLQEDCRNQQESIEELRSSILKNGNPNFAALSDKNRPTKLAELFAGMYDDEWSEALEAMRGGKEENEEEDLKVIEKLLKIIKDSYQLCGQYADSQLQTLAMHMKDVVTFKTPQKKGESSPEGRMLKDTWSIILRYAKSFCKETGTIAIADIKEEFKTTYMKENKMDSLLPELSKYIERCVELIWLMVVQDPPMSLRWATKGEKSDSNFFKFFMSKGRYVKMCAWPAVLLCEKGFVVNKGYIVGENPPPPKEDEKKTKKR